MTSNYYEMENEGSKSAELTAVPSLTNYAYPTMGGETTAIDVVDEDDASPSPANDQQQGESLEKLPEQHDTASVIQEMYLNVGDFAFKNNSIGVKNNYCI